MGYPFLRIPMVKDIHVDIGMAGSTVISSYALIKNRFYFNLSTAHLLLSVCLQMYVKSSIAYGFARFLNCLLFSSQYPFLGPPASRLSGFISSGCCQCQKETFQLVNDIYQLDSCGIGTNNANHLMRL